MGGISFEEIKKRVDQHGERLYHYVTFRNLERVLRNRELTLCSASNMNDKSECRTLVTDMERALCRDLSGEALDRCNSFFSELYKRLSTEYPYAICFSKCADNAAMWERYADNAEGVCIAFNTEQLLKTFYSSKVLITDVFYGFDAKNHEHYKVMFDYFQTGKLDGFAGVKALMDNILICANAYKHESFSSEKEVRVTALWNETPRFSQFDYKLIGNQIKKIVIMRLDEMCCAAKTDFVDLFDEIVVGPRSEQSIDDLKGFLEFCELPELANKIRKSDCPLR